MEEFEKSLDYYHKALSIYEEIGEKSGTAFLTSNIGGIYYSLRDYERSLEYYYKARAAHDELGEKSGLAIVYGNIGSVFVNGFGGQQILMAEEYLLKAIGFGDES
jgi:tetratricopeptide (TPR) repeat protein